MSPRLQVGFKEMNGSVLERDAQSVCSTDSDNEMKDDDSFTGQLSDNEGSISIFKSFFIIYLNHLLNVCFLIVWKKKEKKNLNLFHNFFFSTDQNEPCSLCVLPMDLNLRQNVGI